MAVTSSIVYCTERDLQDVFPDLAQFDLKRRIYNWTTGDVSNMYKSYNTGLITIMFFDGIEGTSVEDDPNADYEFRYSSGNDSIEVFHSSKNPNDMIMESGDDWVNIKTRFIKQASRLVESRLDTRISKEIWLDREGNYPDVIVRLTALQAVILLISSKDPNNEFLEAFKLEKDEMLDGISNGSIALPNMRTRDSSEGFIRKVSVNDSSDLFPIELRGDYHGIGYELLKVKVTTAGIIGVSKMTTYGKSSTDLKSDSHIKINSEIITGDFQHLGVGSLYIRWSGDDVATATTTIDDEYEIELWGSSLGASTSSNFGSISITRSR